MSLSLTAAVSSQFRSGFEISPILFLGGIAQNLPGGLLPIVSLFPGSLSPGQQTFATFKPMPGNTLANNQIGQYPFANQAVAANALIAQPLTISLLMYAPAATIGGMISKLSVFTNLKAATDTHTALGGLYVVATPAYVWDSAILKTLTDVTPDGKQAQAVWQWDFEMPLVTLQQAQQAQNNSMSRISNGGQTDGSLSGTSTTVGSSLGGAAPSAVSNAGTVGGTVQLPLGASDLPNGGASLA